MSADAGTLTTKSFLTWFGVTCIIPSVLKGELSSACFLAFELLINSDPSGPSGLTITTAAFSIGSANINLLVLTWFCPSLRRADCPARLLAAFDVTTVNGPPSSGVPLTISAYEMAVFEAVVPPSGPPAPTFCPVSGQSPMISAVGVVRG